MVRCQSRSNLDNQLWGFESGKLLTTEPGFLEFHGGGIAFSPDGRYFGSASDGLWGGKDHTVHIWEVKTWKEVRLFNAPLERYRCLAFSPDGKHLVTGSAHSEALVWNLGEP
jgi:hypothetical protein